jgi:predicted metal-dependent peptidase
MRDGKMVGLLDPQYRGMDTAQVFHKLKREQQQQQQQSAGQSGQQQQSAGQSGKGAGQQGAMDEHDWEGAKSMTEEERKGLARDIDEALRQGAIAAGKLGSGGARDFQDLLQPKIDWREVLREFVKTTCTGNEFSTWRRPNRRYIGMNVYLPSGVSEQVGELVIAIDTSGSIGGAELSRFLGEVSGICQTVKPSAVRLLYWDTRVVQDEKYVGDDVANIVKTTKPAGGGGTNVTCVPNHMHKHSIKPQAVVVLTDGLLGGRWGTWQVPVLWCIVGSTASAPVGKTVHVRD